MTTSQMQSIRVSTNTDYKYELNPAVRGSDLYVFITDYNGVTNPNTGTITFKIMQTYLKQQECKDVVSYINLYNDFYNKNNPKSKKWILEQDESIIKMVECECKEMLKTQKKDKRVSLRDFFNIKNTKNNNKRVENTVSPLKFSNENCNNKSKDEQSTNYDSIRSSSSSKSSNSSGSSETHSIRNEYDRVDSDSSTEYGGESLYSNYVEEKSPYSQLPDSQSPGEITYNQGENQRGVSINPNGVNQYSNLSEVFARLQEQNRSSEWRNG